MDFQSIIARRRDGEKHSQEELIFLAKGAADGSVPDYQLTAWLMAAFLNPLDAEETAWLTLAMADSGDRIDLSGIPKPWVDKHSTGGVGDKTSMVLLPLLAACGLTVVKMSGRGLGITGGTVDKLGAIPGFRLDLSPSEMKAQAAKIGLALTGQTPDLAPADKTLYALRDATTTVGSVPLIVSSILSKKLAGGAETVVLDVKCGKGGFMPTVDAATSLADSLAKTGKLCGLNIRIAITDMDQPLGSAVGNAVEVREALRVLKGEQSRFSHLCVELAALTLEASGLQPDRESGRKAAFEALTSGAAASKAQAWFFAQGATVDVLEQPEAMPIAPVRVEVKHEGQPAWIAGLDAKEVGLAVVALGGGRQKKDSVIDLAVGVELHGEIGDKLETGQTMFVVHASTEEKARVAIAQIESAYLLSDTAVPHLDPILRIL
jgi:pyrimidine-nucleoside phosphorylase